MGITNLGKLIANNEHYIQVTHMLQNQILSTPILTLRRRVIRNINIL